MARGTRVRWTEKALKRLRFIGNFKSKESRASAAALITRVRHAALTLAEQPEIGKAGRIATTRELAFPDLPYSLAYQITPEGIDILALIPTARQWPLVM